MKYRSFREMQRPICGTKLLIRLLFHLGCRISEALALEVKDIDFDHRHGHDSTS